MAWIGGATIALIGLPWLGEGVYLGSSNPPMIWAERDDGGSPRGARGTILE